MILRVHVCVILCVRVHVYGGHYGTFSKPSLVAALQMQTATSSRAKPSSIRVSTPGRASAADSTRTL